MWLAVGKAAEEPALIGRLQNSMIVDEAFFHSRVVLVIRHKTD